MKTERQPKMQLGGFFNDVAGRFQLGVTQSNVCDNIGSIADENYSFKSNLKITLAPCRSVSSQFDIRQITAEVKDYNTQYFKNDIKAHMK